MPKTVQIRNLDDDVYAALVRRAAETGISVPELLRIEATRLAARPSVEAWLKSVRSNRGSPPYAGTSADIIATLDEWRGPWPDAGG